MAKKLPAAKASATKPTASRVLSAEPRPTANWQEWTESVVVECSNGHTLSGVLTIACAGNHGTHYVYAQGTTFITRTTASNGSKSSPIGFRTNTAKS